jgi:hypothetical protein
MIRKHPGRVLIVLAVLAGILFALGGPGEYDRSGDAWEYISGFSFIGFLLTTLVFVVLAVYALATRRRRGQPE